MSGIYFDNSTTTRPSEKAISKMLPFYSQRWGSPIAPHQMGQELFPPMEESLRAIYALLGAKESDNFVFTASGAEAVNHAIFSTYLDVTRHTGKNQFVTSRIDEAPSLMSLARLEQLGCVVKMAEADSTGKVTAAAIADVITPRTAMVSLSWANGLTGVIHPIAEIAALCRDRGIVLHLDASHVLGKLFFRLDEIAPHLVTFSGELLHAPQGTGGLYMQEGQRLSSFIVGGLEQAGRRAGSWNIPGLVALGEAAREAQDACDLMCTEVARLRNQLEAGILREYPEAVVFFKEQERLPHCTAIGFPGISNEALMFLLNRRKVFVSMGGGSFQQIALILAASGVSKELANTALSFSLSRATTDDEIDRAVAIIGEVARSLRKCAGQIV